MNEHDIDDAVRRFHDHPILGPATRTLENLRDFANRNSDGWCYWPKPGRAANKLMALIEGDPRDRWSERDDVTLAQLRAAYAPIKAFRTRGGYKFEIEEVVTRDEFKKLLKPLLSPDS